MFTSNIYYILAFRRIAPLQAPFAGKSPYESCIFSLCFLVDMSRTVFSFFHYVINVHSNFQIKISRADLDLNKAHVDTGHMGLVQIKSWTRWAEATCDCSCCSTTLLIPFTGNGKHPFVSLQDTTKMVQNKDGVLSVVGKIHRPALLMGPHQQRLQEKQVLTLSISPLAWFRSEKRSTTPSQTPCWKIYQQAFRSVKMSLASHDNPPNHGSTNPLKT